MKIVITGGRDGPRRVYRGTPGAPSAYVVGLEFERLASRVYAGLRDGTLDADATFDLACHLIDWHPRSQAVQELAEHSVAGTRLGRLAELASQVLEECGYEPGFDVEPRLLTELQDALAAVQADMRATGLAGPVQLAFVEDAPGRHAFAQFRGSFSFSSGISPAGGRSRVFALVAVADDAQDAVMGKLMTVWPVCPAHALGGHPREHAARAVWWCNGGGGHAIARIGHWPA